MMDRDVQTPFQFLIATRFAACNNTCEYTTWNFNSSRNNVPRAVVAVRGPFMDATAEPNCSNVLPSLSGTTPNQDRVRS
jgi:hypothetical protein